MLLKLRWMFAEIPGVKKVCIKKKYSYEDNQCSYFDIIIA